MVLVQTTPVCVGGFFFPKMKDQIQYLGGVAGLEFPHNGRSRGSDYQWTPRPGVLYRSVPQPS